MLRLCLLKLLRQSKLDECQPLTATGAISFFFSRKKEKETIISRNNRETILKSMMFPLRLHPHKKNKNYR